MASVTITGGPFTDALGNPINGIYSFSPVPQVDDIADDLPLEVHGNLGGWASNATSGVQPSAAGTFSASLPIGASYNFHLRTQTQVVEGLVTIPSTGSSIEALL